jgi:hypothetical protein
LPNVSATRTRSPVLDEACAVAVEMARLAAAEVAGSDQVGAHAGVEAEAERVATHLFDCRDRAYAGWRWAVTVARASRARSVTVSEVVLLPGPEALLAPAWVPWKDRLRPGDLGVGDLLPAHSDDERLVPVTVLHGDEGLVHWDDADDEGAAVPGPTAARASRPVRVLSAIGRDMAAVRWYRGDHGPHSALAHAAPGRCESCGFLVRLDGPLGRVFGVCANEYAPDDGRVVSTDHGCGAHSEAAGRTGGMIGQDPVVDELGYDLVHSPGVSMEDTVFETLDHG